MSDDGNRVIAEDGDKVSIHYTGWLHDPKSADKKGKQNDAYGTERKGKIPPNSRLIFDIEVTEVTKGKK
ncbi:hypothetical protein N7462_005913 [Penicillium macrosclerotiorum]|uniref:uncharacterized protein n=1 Tax=Penicillium macrosclerotiorum TaxID=303699 RepID=UPI0025483E7D|nr:uncharacterized protein N7462_005913 [Penicillium macrosclerotiorum]KAJ5682748.1 hypothetical protein N7462_005913 [Penicillium macrosclerotiorum]